MYQDGEKEQKLFTLIKQINLYKYSDFLSEFAVLFLFSFLYYFSIKHYCRWALIQIYNDIQYIH